MSFGSDIHDKPGPLSSPIERRHTTFPCESIPYVLSTADAAVILLSSLIGGTLYQWSIGNPTPNLLPHCAVGLLASFIHILRISGGGYYDFQYASKPRVEAVDILVSWVTTGLLLAFFAFLLKIGVAYSRGAFVIFFFLAPVGLLGVRKVSKLVLARAIALGMIGRRDMVLIGDQLELSVLEPRDLLAFFGAGDVNRFMLSKDEDPLEREANDIRVVNSVANFVRERNAREILLAVPWTDSARIDFIREHIKVLPVSVRLLPDMRVRSLTDYSSSARQNIMSVEILGAPLSLLEQGVKRLVDIVLASIALVFFLPVMLLTAIAIKLDGSGPVIFRQFRKGFNGQQFVMLKFRTMTVQENGPSVTQATRNDPRVTGIGKLLRASSIDELPQLINVLSGEMSLIGPRPHALAHDSQFEKMLSDYAFRHHVKPGITGWAQCNGARGATPKIEQIQERVKLDLWYINNWSLWLDFQIVVKTFFEVLRKRNAF
ncbi:MULTISPECIES: undecaprenyl-phosphate glucose phosphotransferase [Bradyrhizobium]|uniref:Undecaprenyl-phosphate galactose phosphotransferase/putative colanic acid biosysnthesis UDP-glucose lipid carrier transferase n=2 Tax=Bradyrhizobium TaxID=374 RepID=A0ABY0Q6N7_9BRAD|nr:MULTISPECIES: undecaprenyl-phosphate glucose phosphotransferase [Bradyrhizobium]SDJ59952.1 undecaprenyl-phosphate galactose phosphotransferase/putative colanic acid biosysnthesis UDP-glucose lipid carrier transferase [Bradyrhizobium ottawaense]SEC38215.1 undecaprenyl-phosphate galactose phosphotransferase/putative colanic acid biosysnthesis UDP-glucose lipid carrier transferase [Bradyrhizobium lablabi]